MIRLELILGLLIFLLWLFCLIEVIRSDDGAINHLPKLVWLLIVLFFPLVGSVLWLSTGRPAGAPPTPRFEGSSQLRVYLRAARRCPGRGRGLPRMGVPTLPIRKT